MDYRQLGRTWIRVSELCLGTMTFGREADEPTSRKLVDRFLETGGNFVDTADVYAEGESEEITGRALQGRRDDVVLATKVRFPTGPGVNDVGASRRHIRMGIEASLRRLGTEWIDLYQIHCWDARTPLVLGVLLTVLNIGFNVALITGAGPFPRMGTAGAAAGVSIAGAIITIISVYLLCSGRLSQFVTPVAEPKRALRAREGREPSDPNRERFAAAVDDLFRQLGLRPVPLAPFGSKVVKDMLS